MFKKIKLAQLEGLILLVAMKYCQLDTGSRAEILTNEQDSFPQ